MLRRPATALAAAAVALASAAAAFAPSPRAGESTVLRALVCPAPRPGGGGGKKEHLITRARWLRNTVVTEYWPVPERWFIGKPVHAPGIPGLHRVDWLYSGRGLPMEGDGVGLDGRHYHFAGPYGQPWVNAAGRWTTPCANGSWTGGRPFWLSFGWRDAGGAVTFPLSTGGWYHGQPARSAPPPPNLRFAPGRSLALTYWHSVAVDPKVIPLGSRVFVPAYCSRPYRGWFVAQDTGGAVIGGHHVDVYRPAPATPDGGAMRLGQRIYVVPPHARAPGALPRC